MVKIDFVGSWKAFHDKDDVVNIWFVSLFDAVRDEGTLTTFVFGVAALIAVVAGFLFVF